MSTNFAHGSCELPGMAAVLKGARPAVPATRGSPAGCYRDVPDKQGLAQFMKLQDLDPAVAARRVAAS